VAGLYYLIPTTNNPTNANNDTDQPTQTITLTNQRKQLTNQRKPTNQPTQTQACINLRALLFMLYFKNKNKTVVWTKIKQNKTKQKQTYVTLLQKFCYIYINVH
jgi:hypothetical protein